MSLFFKLQIVYYLCNLHLTVKCLGILKKFFLQKINPSVVEYHKTNGHFNSSWWTPLLWQCGVNPLLVGRKCSFKTDIIYLKLHILHPVCIS